MTIKELITQHNDIANVTTIKSWKKSKTLLEAKIADAKRAAMEDENEGKLTIRQVAEEALLEIVSTDEDGNQLGHPYAVVVSIVKALFPKAETTSRSLAWYASKMRSAQVTVPFRPRAPRS